jgi:hypothetical protein
MNFYQTGLPWSGAPVLSSGNIYTYFARRLPEHLSSYLPSSITLLLDPEVEGSAAGDFLEEMTVRLAGEFRRRRRRRDRFVECGLFDPAEIHAFLTGRCQVQPWIIYYSKSGGLGPSAEEICERDEDRGVVPCSTMRNHGVAWRRTPTGHYQTWLVTGRREGKDWDWDSDIGHESAHAAFAQIPLFLQRVQYDIPSADLSLVDGVDNLNHFHLARLSYMYTEIAVVAMRGEKRDTESGLPVVERRDELFAFLELSEELMPGMGFDRALAACHRADGFIDVEGGEGIFEIGAAVMRVVPYLKEMIGGFTIPTTDWFKSIERHPLRC